MQGNVEEHHGWWGTDLELWWWHARPWNSKLQCEFLFSACYNRYSNRKSNSNSNHNKNKKHHHQHQQKKKKTQITKPFSLLGLFFRLSFCWKKKHKKTPGVFFWAGEFSGRWTRCLWVLLKECGQGVKKNRQICGLRESGGMRSPTEDEQIGGKLPNL